MSKVSDDSFISVLEKFYNYLGKSKYVDNDKVYLLHAFKGIENLWIENLKLLKKLNFVLIGEAPLYKDGKSYFYNPDSGATNFFNYKNCEDICGKLISSSKLKNGQRLKKHEMLDKLCYKGFLILDAFPFCFADGYTIVNYRKLKKIDLVFLFNLIKCDFLVEKLTLIFHKNPNVKFGFRYSINQKSIGEEFQKTVTEIGFKNIKNIPSFHEKRNLNSKLIETKFF
ncbi:hypothetical protein N9V16_01815 [SAR116 cluster bacterium]|nr:hypothetical protein [SAR116 cluster bacterium]